jgi:Protein tyrosine and serine/threonine kinase
VYSYGILLWEIAICHKPFKGMTVDQHSDLVVVQGYRPKISIVPGSDSFKKLIQDCWSAIPNNRPTFTEVRLGLANEVEAHRRQEELEEIERQRKVAPKTGNLRMRMMRQRRSGTRTSYAKSGVEGSFGSVPFS